MITRKRTKWTWESRLFVAAFLAIPLIEFLVFYVFVNFGAFFSAFQKTEKGVTVWTLANFEFVIQLFKTGEFVMIFRNTFIYFGLSIVMFFTGLIICFFIYKKIPGYRIFRILFLLPSLISSVVIVAVFKNFVSEDGLAPIFQKLFGLDYTPALLAEEPYALIMCLVYTLWMGCINRVILWGGTFARIPESVIESAKLDGVKWWQEIFYIIIPMVWPTVSMLLILSFAGIFGSSGSEFLLTKGQFGTNTFSTWMYLQVYGVSNAGDSNSNMFNIMASLGMIVSVVSVIIVIISRKIADKIGGEVQY